MLLIKFPHHPVDKPFGQYAVQEAEDFVLRAADILRSGTATCGNRIELFRHLERCHPTLLVFLHRRHGFADIDVRAHSFFRLAARRRKTRRDIARHQHADMDAESAHLVLQRQSQGVYRRLGCAIETLVRDTQHGSYAAGEKDASGFALTHVRQYSLHAVECAEEIDFHLTVGIFGGSELNSSADAEAGVRDKHIYLSCLINHLPGGRLGLFGTGASHAIWVTDSVDVPLRDHSNTRQPFWAKYAAVALPMPDEPPVITTVFIGLKLCLSDSLDFGGFANILAGEIDRKGTKKFRTMQDFMYKFRLFLAYIKKKQ